MNATIQFAGQTDRSRRRAKKAACLVRIAPWMKGPSGLPSLILLIINL
jgi:hypothetical protein